MTTPDNTATTWRDLADQLTDQQRADLAHLEGENVPAEMLLGFAREHIETRLIDTAYADVPVPPGATTDAAGWGKNLQRDGYSRSLVWRSYEGGMADLRLAGSHISVDIDGRQQCDGSFTRHVSLWGFDEGGELTSDQARAVAALLTAAADELDRLDN